MKFPKMLKIWQFLVLVANFVSCQTDYCSSSLCSDLEHIGCNHSGDFHPSCPNDKKIISFTDDDKQLILDEHNKLRNKLASGQQIGFKTASRMTTMVWNNELAELAELNAKSCKFSHDECRNTEKFQYAGQNIELLQVSDYFNSPKEVIENSINFWYEEVIDANQSDLDAFQSNEKKIGHFTQIVNDLSNEVGCGAVQFTENGWKTSLFVCNYARTNLENRPIYTSGDVASGCISGINENFKALCSLSEDVDPNSV